MIRYRSSLAGLMAVVIYVAISVAALKSASMLWASVLFTIVVVVLLTTTLSAFFSRSPFLRGFIVFGWGYLALAFKSLPTPEPLTNLIINYFWIRHSSFVDTMTLGVYDRVILNVGLNYETHALYTNAIAVFQISHILVCMVFASIGGMLARSLSKRAGGPVPSS
jgi:hypothetical protein